MGSYTRSVTKKSATGLDPDTVVRAALELLDDKGADAVSVRGVADRLGVRMNTVLWHAKTKARLLELMADAIVAGAPVEDLPEPWRDRVRELAHRYRRALLARRDGARIVAGTYAAEPATLRFADTMVGALLGAGFPARQAVWVCWTIVYFVLGLTQEEQASPDALGEDFGRLLASGEYPALALTREHLEDGSFDERFDHGLSLVLQGLGSRGEDGA